MHVVIVGAGLAGLACGRILTRAGVHVTLLEKSDGIGGRVRTDLVDGCRLDRGFQVLFTAYPAAQRLLDYAALDLRPFEPGAVIAQGDRRHVLSDPARDPDALLPSLLTGIVPLADKLRTWELSGELGPRPDSAILDGPDETTERFLRRRGFSDRYLDHFIRPFFGGIFLDRSLTTSARAFRFDWKMLSVGETVLPARGMGAIPTQLAVDLVDRVRLHTAVEALVRTPAGRVVGVTTASGETVAADRVVLSTPAPEAARLSGLKTPKGCVGVTSVYFLGDAPLWPGRKILLNANTRPFVNHAAPLTAVVPEYAPAGKHLLCANVLGVPEHDDEALVAAVRADLSRMFTGDPAAHAAFDTYRPLAIYRIPYAQFAQPRGFSAGLPGNDTGIDGLLFAAEFTAASSINAALRSGEKAAATILGDV
jgi:phytoene dehydrogenase-like protein